MFVDQKDLQKPMRLSGLKTQFHRITGTTFKRLSALKPANTEENIRERDN